MEKLWSKTEVTYLKRHHDGTSVEDLAQRFHTDVETVRAKMQELGLAAGSSQLGVDEEALAAFSAGVDALNDKSWQAAADHFETAINAAEGRQLRDRARQYLAICREALADPEPVDDPYLAALMAKNRGDFDAALETAGRIGDLGSDERAAYLVASIQALRGDDDEAVGTLGTAIELEPKNRVHAYHDPDFTSLREREDFQSLLGAAALPA